MSEDDAKSIDPQALTPADAARVLGISVDMLRVDVGAGAPTNADGSINLVHYAAWLNREMRSADGP